MKHGVYFIAGIYGTGKTTVGKELARQIGIPCYEASELIKKRSGETYGATKHVKDLNRNQDILAEEVAEILKKGQAIILTGHFAIFNKNRRVEAIPSEVFESLGLTAIILLETETENAIKHLSERDNKNYTNEELNTLATEEKRLCTDTAKRRWSSTRIYSHGLSIRCV